MRVLTGDECGLLKECIPEYSRQPSSHPQETDDAPPPMKKGESVRRIGYEKQTRRRGVIDMTFLSGSDDDDYDNSFATLRLTGSVEFWKDRYSSSLTGSKQTRRVYGNYERQYMTNNVFEQHHKDKEGTTTEKKSTKGGRPLGLGCFPNHERLCAGTCWEI